jgi:uncharacterized protein
VSDENVEIARNAYAVFGSGDFEAAMDFLDPEIEWHMWEAFARESRVFRGHDGVRHVLALFQENIDDFRVEPHEFIDAGKHIIVPVSFHGRAKGTQQALSYELVQVWTVRDRKAVRLDVYSSKDEAFEAVGLPSPAG